MKIRYLMMEIVFALVAFDGAQAADIILTSHTTTSVSVTAPSLFNWNGFYAGGEVGSSWSSSRINEASDRIRPVGLAGGLYAGYNIDVGSNIIFGLDTDILWTKVEAVHAQYTGAEKYLEDRLKQKWVGTSRIRVGYAADRWLPYVTGGVSYAKFNISSIEREVNGDRDVECFNENRNRVGLIVAVGIDHAINDNSLLRLEYRRTEYGQNNYNLDKDNQHYNLKYNADDFHVGFAYKY